MRSVVRLLRTYLLTGIAVLIPVAATVYILAFGFNVVDNLLGRVVQALVGRRVPGTGAVLTVLFTLLVGMVATNVVGRRLIHIGERILARIPLVRSIYNSVKQIVDSFAAGQKGSFKKVAMVEYPRKGIWSVGFVTNEDPGELQDRTGVPMVTVFIPTSPNPTSGWFVVVPRDQVILLDMTAEEAFRMIVSGGIVIPPRPRRSNPGPQGRPKGGKEGRSAWGGGSANEDEGGAGLGPFRMRLSAWWERLWGRGPEDPVGRTR